MNSNWFSVHTHSNFSVLDGMSPVDVLVEKAAKYKHPGFGLTDHGVMSGTVKAYKACKAAGIKFFPGIESYIIDPNFDKSTLDDAGKAQRYHLGVLGLDLRGYQGLTQLSTLSFTRPRYNRFPRLLVDDLIEWGEDFGEHIAITTGCVFGLLEKTYLDQGEDAAEGILRMLEQVTPNLYVELQKHGIDGEDELIDAIGGLAEKRGLPIIITADLHYADQRQKAAHNLMKRMVYSGADDEFPGDTFHYPTTGWMREKWSPSMWAKTEESCADLLSKWDLHIPELDTYKPHVPKMADDPMGTLANLCNDALRAYVASEGISDDAPYKDRLEEELDVIADVDVADYALLVRNTVEFFEREEILTESRGSVNGSLVFFLLGATQVDPLKWGTDFRRFLDRSRKGQSPDVDQDIADSDRWKVIEYLNNLKLNGVEYKTSRIGTYAELGQKKDDPNDTGSAFNTYIGYLRNKYIDDAVAAEKEQAAKEGRKPVLGNARKQGAIDYNSSPDSKIKTLEDVKALRPADYKGLKEIIGMKSVYKSKGTHAGGILISGVDVNIENSIPLMYIPSGEGTWVSQYTMKDVEQFGLLKLDILGQTSLSVMQKCQEFIGRSDTRDFSWIPFDDKMTIKMLSNQRNYTGIFHAEGYAKGIVMKQMKPKSVEEIIQWSAISMPGVVDSGAKDIFLERRAKKITDYGYDHPIFKEVFDKTYGVMVYQEQVIAYCHAIGMTDEEVTGFFKIVKDSGSGAVERNRKRLEEARPRFFSLSAQQGIKEEDIDWVWKQCIAMGGYAFSLNHAAGYGIRTYRTAYLKAHYPAAYMGAMLYCWSGSNNKVRYRGREVSKEYIYLEETDRLKIPVLPVQLNASQANWSVYKGKYLRKGYQSVKGIGSKAAELIAASQPYKDMDDFCQRAKVSGTVAYLNDGSIKGVVKALEDAGALRFDK